MHEMKFGIFFRLATADTTMPSGVQIKANTMVTYHGDLHASSEELFPNADRFDPDTHARSFGAVPIWGAGICALQILPFISHTYRQSPMHRATHCHY
jgi:cytochrome P450